RGGVLGTDLTMTELDGSRQGNADPKADSRVVPSVIPISTTEARIGGRPASHSASPRSPCVSVPSGRISGQLSQVRKGRRSVKRCILALSFLCSTWAGNARASLIINGGFETGDYTGWSVNFTPPSNAALIITDGDFPGQGRVHEGIYSV